MPGCQELTFCIAPREQAVFSLRIKPLRSREGKQFAEGLPPGWGILAPCTGVTPGTLTRTPTKFSMEEAEGAPGFEDEQRAVAGWDVLTFPWTPLWVGSQSP